MPDSALVTTYYNPMGLPSRMVSSVAGTLVDGTIPGGQSNGVGYDLAGRLTQLRFPAGGNLWRTYAYAPFNQQTSNGGRIDAIFVGTTSDGLANSYNRPRLSYTYDAAGRVTGFEG